jgi:hypothetical protein
MAEQCRTHVYSGRRDDMRGHQCFNNAKLDGLCTIHQPEYIAEKRRKSDERYKAKQANTDWAKLKRAEDEIADLKASNYQLEVENKRLRAEVERWRPKNAGLADKWAKIKEQANGN